MRTFLLFYIGLTILSAGCRAPREEVLVKLTALSDYPSGSGIAFYRDKIYLMGDDAPYLLVTDTAFITRDTIPFFSSSEKRIPKNIKKDPEGATILNVNKNPLLFIIGSGSNERLRNFCWIFDIATQVKTEVSLDTFYNRLVAAGIRELNVEGIAALPGGVVLASRGNKSYLKNHLIFTSDNFWMNQANAPISIATIGVTTDTSLFSGISGLEYSKLSDKLLLTVSTENTYNSLADGVIGKSYLWIINDISSKTGFSGINPSSVTDLETIDSRFNNQKIESVCIIQENKKSAELVFVSDDDKGGSVLFKVRLKRKL
ncbi:MAG: hypothetical protein ABIP80_05435 [Ferruginibacter sp.]